MKLRINKKMTTWSRDDENMLMYFLDKDAYIFDLANELKKDEKDVLEKMRQLNLFKCNKYETTNKLLSDILHELRIQNGTEV